VITLNVYTMHFGTGPMSFNKFIGAKFNSITGFVYVMSHSTSSLRFPLNYRDISGILKAVLPKTQKGYFYFNKNIQ
jgi:hypothetical protein